MGEIPLEPLIHLLTIKGWAAEGIHNFGVPEDLQEGIEI